MDEYITLEEVMESIDDYLLDARRKKEFQRILDIFTEACTNDIISVDNYIAYTECAEELLYIETPEDFQKFLTDHQYDPKTKTVVYNGRRVRFDDISSMISNSLNIKLGSPKAKDAIKAATGGTPAVAVTGLRSNSNTKQNDKNIQPCKNAFDVYNFLRNPADGTTYKRALAAANKTANFRSYVPKIKGIGYDSDSVENFTREELEFILGHEYGHIQDYSNRRKSIAAISYITKYGTSSLPKDLRRELIQWKQKLKSGNITSADTKALQNFNQRMEAAIRQTPQFKNDSQLQHAYNYAKNDIMANQALADNNVALGPDPTVARHDNNPDEVRADAEGYNQLQKYLRKTGQDSSLTNVSQIAGNVVTDKGTDTSLALRGIDKNNKLHDTIRDLARKKYGAATRRRMSAGVQYYNNVTK